MDEVSRLPPKNLYLFGESFQHSDYKCWLKKRDFDSILLVYSNVLLCETHSPSPFLYSPLLTYIHDSFPIPFLISGLCLHALHIFWYISLVVIWSYPWHLVKGRDSLLSNEEENKCPQSTRDPEYYPSLCKKQRKQGSLLKVKWWFLFRDLSWPSSNVSLKPRAWGLERTCNGTKSWGPSPTHKKILSKQNHKREREYKYGEFLHLGSGMPWEAEKAWF